MVRTAHATEEIHAPLSARVVRCHLEEGAMVQEGDTLLVFSRELEQLRLSERREGLERIQWLLADLEAILAGRLPLSSEKHIQGHQAYLARARQLDVESAYLEQEYHAARGLYDEQVIPVLEFEKARSAYLSAQSRLAACHAAYRRQVEEERFDLLLQEQLLHHESREITKLLQQSVVLAPLGGVLHQCKGISRGTYLEQGQRLARLSPHGKLVAECYVSSRDITTVYPGMPVRIKFDRKERISAHWHTLKVNGMDPEALMVDGQARFRVRCTMAPQEKGMDLLRPGMTFTANLVLYRASLAALLLDRLNTFSNPRITRQEREGP
jgi:HlyD family secretion protein